MTVRDFSTNSFGSFIQRWLSTSKCFQSGNGLYGCWMSCSSHVLVNLRSHVNDDTRGAVRGEESSKLCRSALVSDDQTDGIRLRSNRSSGILTLLVGPVYS